MKTCTKCEKEKDESEYHKKRNGNLQPICKECKREYDKEWYKTNTRRRDNLNKRAKERIARNKKFIREYKLSIGCQKCGYKKTYHALEFHHKDGDDKKYNVSLMKTLSIETIKKEIEKCMVVCANCHREIHGEEIDF
jgi:hypothetical protein